MKEYFVYIMTSDTNTVLYTGVTNNLYNRAAQHKQGVGSKFSRKYRLKKLVYYEVFGSTLDAIAREKQIKAGSRKKKIELIEKDNPEWHDLFA